MARLSMRRLRLIPTLFIVLLLALAFGCPARAQKTGGSSRPVTPVTTLVAIDELNRDALSGQEPVLTLGSRGSARRGVATPCWCITPRGCNG